jgi:large subunit ribosomal protein L32
MPLPKRKTSRMRARQRKAGKRYRGLQTVKCPSCGAATRPHRVCPACGVYQGKQVLTMAE